MNMHDCGIRSYTKVVQTPINFTLGAIISEINMLPMNDFIKIDLY